MITESSDALLNGVLCSQPLDGVRFTLRQYQKVEEDLDVQDLDAGSLAAVAGSVSDADVDQLSVAIDRAVRAACVSAGPCLLEPVFEAEVVCGSEDDVVGIYSALSVRGGTITSERQHATSPTYYVRGQVPVARSFGLVGVSCTIILRKSRGKAKGTTVRYRGPLQVYIHPFRRLTDPSAQEPRPLLRVVFLTDCL